jgi:hypothetical protein
MLTPALAADAAIALGTVEGFWVSKPKNARVFYDVVLGWLDEHIGPAANVSAKAR